MEHAKTFWLKQPVSPLQSVLLSFIGVYITSMLWPRLPSIFALVVVATIVALLTLCIMLCRRLYRNLNIFLCIIGGLSGLFWASVVGHWYYTWQIQGIAFQQSVVISGRITEVKQTPFGLSFSLAADRIAEHNFVFSRHILLRWFEPDQTVEYGDHVRLVTSLKPAQGLGNPHSFDYKRWLLSKNVIASGNIKGGDISVVSKSLPTLRQQIINKIQQLELSHQRWLLALTIGYRDQLSDDDWQLLQRTGLSHLFAISGLHLTVISGFIFAILALGIRGIGVLFASIASKSATQTKISQNPYNALIIIITMLGSLGYAYLSGWQIPVVRAFYTLCIVSTLLCVRLVRHATTIILVALFTIVLFEPYSIYALSFWLSVFAVCSIVFIAWRLDWSSKSSMSWLKLAILSQVCLTFMLLPMGLYHFNTLSLVSVFANLALVPVVTLILLPLSLMAVMALMAGFVMGEELLTLANLIFQVLISLLTSISEWSMSALQDIVVPVYVLVFSFSGFVVLALPTFKTQRRTTALLFVPLLVSFLPKEQSPNDWQVHVFDVGQGTAVAITQGQRALLYDTGPGVPERSSIARQVILPFMHAHGIYTLDFLIVSHFDNDHAGGLHDVSTALSIHQHIDAHDCSRREPVMWGRLSIQVMWPIAASKHAREQQENTYSCVVKVSDGTTSVLLTGDIDNDAELALVRHQVATRQADLKAEILIAPHHGSKTSSSYAFIGAVQPEHVIFTTGFLNRWGFPNKDVQKRYDHLEINTLNTANEGYIRFRIEYCERDANQAPCYTYAQTQPITYDSFKRTISPRWYRQIN
ncbi:DNA internalization-related competence protein ComEC/Rec2 [Alteromonas facilis]|uniref:DNA internalization-related competence protein ComEC/Rec2 n=1 Tax=Alteromonas facilis TaxID=2048004 RepID=UPI000C2923B6|nr:DNA internalization-related competence protein ComEC/Rec2 [Alteromonas facilis]